MAPTTLAPCRFFALGNCKNGVACAFVHEVTAEGSQLPSVRPPNPHPTSITDDKECDKSAQICSFFLRGSCRYGGICKYHHPSPNLQSETQLSTAVEIVNLAQTTSIPSNTTSDSRSTVPCRFHSRPAGCQNDLCPYLHAQSTRMEQCKEDDEDMDDDGDDETDLVRHILGATVHFNDHGHVVDVDFPTDYSCACVMGFLPGVTPTTVVDRLSEMRINITADCVRILGYPLSTATKANVTVRDPGFASLLCRTTNSQSSMLCASIVPVNATQSNGRRVQVSWHKATRSVWLNFGRHDIARKVADKFNDLSYRCLGHSVKSSSPSHSGSSARFGSNTVPWTIILSNVPGHATAEDVRVSISPKSDKPRHIEMGRVSYDTSEPDVSIAVRSRLEKYGRLETYQLLPTTGGKRAKVVATFCNDGDAKQASMLNNTILGVLGKGKITVMSVQSVKVKVLTTVYHVLKRTIEEKIPDWTQQHLKFQAYVDPHKPLTTLKIQGSDAKDVARAGRSLDSAVKGIVLAVDGKPLWTSALSSNGTAYHKIMSTAEALNVVISREKSRNQLRFYGPTNKTEEAITRIKYILEEQPLLCRTIDLDPHQFAWAVHGGFKTIQSEIGDKIVVFDVVSKRITINGTSQQFEVASAMIDSKCESIKVRETLEALTNTNEDCVVCFCEADNPVQCSCEHTYCLECFQGFCESAASTSRGQFQIQCCGSEGTCSTIFTLQELRRHLPSLVFEDVLQKSFEEYCSRRPDEFHACPTPDCGHIYRCSGVHDENEQTRRYICPACFEQLCTHCHAQHGEYTCAEYKDIASGGFEALEKLKKKLNIKDCPRCKTSMEKTMGCNHMTCQGCKAHICWVCMAVFDTSGPCYQHMNERHGGIGIDVDDGW